MHPTKHSLFIYTSGGSRSHRVARRVYYQHIHGLILVHDLTNKKSEENLRNWLAEVFHTREPTLMHKNYAMPFAAGATRLALCKYYYDCWN